MMVSLFLFAWRPTCEPYTLSLHDALPISSRLPTVLTAGHVTVATLSSVTVTGPLRRKLRTWLTTSRVWTRPVDFCVSNAAQGHAVGVETFFASYIAGA